MALIRISFLALCLVAAISCAGSEQEARALLNEALQRRNKGDYIEALRLASDVVERHRETEAATEAARLLPALRRLADRQRSELLNVQLLSVEGALDLFRLDVGRYPLESEGLLALLEEPPKVEGWNGPYMTSNDYLSEIVYMSNGEAAATFHPDAVLPSIPLSRFAPKDAVSPEGRNMKLHVTRVSPSDTSKMELLVGRLLNRGDRNTLPLPVLGNQRLAEIWRFGTEFEVPDRGRLVLVGIVGDGYQVPTVYLPVSEQ
ncbi:MAG TPA: type II secretion system protein GspG [Acidobacteriota bacterium]|nr:type II secretion system protein GspG [Acidobacteriota bacterium]